ncbi:tRNA lysidine(34) synthetase TilS [Terriglobus albidus]|uniref:tRNA(Ile)-lysidine synthase n=1 Tax=Terriglobus albidus TaxID=1592106 RepID=A0A5B9EGC1_9BACT|nr:tRNA lysidine(34) synthetase TilS [Terriglobus albidus]QEE30859.1 tRNA lysidine(34) synthetase TilS [Terriglobus albidus]
MAEGALNLNGSLFRVGDRVAVGVSGGADSVALLLALADRRADLGIGLSAVHVEHGIRGAEGEADAAFVQQLCEHLDIPVTVERVDVPARVEREKESIEEAARTLRYQIFAQLDVDAVATAHTQDDQAETVLMKLLRGAWTEGLGAISPVVTGKPKIIRPMLSVSRTEVEAFLRTRGQEWRDDSTNRSLELTRNRVRHELMPLLRQFNPQITPALAQVADLARAEEEFWTGEMARLLPGLVLPGTPVRGGGRSSETAPGARAVAMEIERLRPLSLAARRRVLRGAAAGLGCRLSFVETAKLLAMCGLPGEGWTPDPTVSPKPGAQLHLPGGLRARRTARELQLSRI